MKKVLISMGFAALALGATAQVKIKDGSVTSGTTPNPNAILELESNNKGLLCPRVSLTATNAVLPGRTMVAGMVVYNTATAGSGATAVTPGFYYSNGTVWVRLIDAPATSTAWSLTGNAGTTPGTNFIGTTDNADLVFKSHNVQAGWLNTSLGNTAFGATQLPLTTTGSANTGIGVSTLTSNTTGSNNTALVAGTLEANTTGGWNTAVGTAALQSNQTGNYNTAVGLWALTQNTAGNSNTAIGTLALQAIAGTSDSNNVALGYRAAFNQTSGNNNIAIGYNTLLPNTTGNYQLNIGNAIYGTGVDSTVTNAANIGINTNAPNSTLQVAGSVSTPIIVQPSSSYTLKVTDYTVVFTATATATLPAASSVTGRIYRLVNQTASATLTTSSIIALNGSTVTSIPAASAMTVQSDGTNWRQIQ